MMIATYDGIAESVFPWLNPQSTTIEKNEGYMAAEIHPSSQRFHDILNELGALHDKKQLDYGTPTDPFANVRGSLDWGITPWVGALVRASDKFKRLQKFARHGKLANEAVEDSFRDLAVYAIIVLVLFEEQQEQVEEVATALS